MQTWIPDPRAHRMTRDKISSAQGQEKQRTHSLISPECKNPSAKDTSTLPPHSPPPWLFSALHISAPCRCPQPGFLKVPVPNLAPDTQSLDSDRASIPAPSPLICLPTKPSVG